MPLTAAELQTKIDKFVVNMNRYDTILNGDEDSTTTVDGALVVPSVANTLSRIRGILKVTWAGLATIVGQFDGQVGMVPPSDAGTHTDPVVGGTVDNSGIFTWVAAGALANKWQRVGDYGDVGTVQAEIDALEALMFDQQKMGTTIPSAATIELGAATGEFVNVTGTTNISSLGTGVTNGRWRRVRFNGILTLVHSANLILPAGLDIVTAANDCATFIHLSGNVWICSSYQKASGQPVIPTSVANGGTGATSAVGGIDALSTKGANLASAATVDLGAATGQFVDISGTTTITSFGTTTAGVKRTVQFLGALTLTHSASLALPGSVSIVTAAGDVAEFVSRGGGVWKCVGYTRHGDVALKEAIDDRIVGLPSVVAERVVVFAGTSGKNVHGNKPAPSGDFVGTTDTQTMTGKTLGSPIINNATIVNPTFSGTKTGLVKADVGLGNADNTSDLNKPISNATQAALDDKVSITGRMARPGDSPLAYAESLAGGDPEAVASLTVADTQADSEGRVVRITGPGLVAQRALVAFEVSRIYQIRAVIRRRVDTSDPSGDSVRVAIAWYDQNRNRLAGGNATTVIDDVDDLIVASGRRQVTATISRTPGLGTLDAPAGAVYGRGWVETFGAALPQTDVEIIDIIDTSDLTVWSPSTAAFDARLVVLESLDAGSRLTALESAVGAPSKLTFPTQGDAVAATISGSIDEIELLNYATVGDGQGYRLKRSAGVPTYGFQSADLAWWEPSGNPKSRIFADIADAEAAFIPADTTEIRIIARGGARFRRASGGEYTATPALLRFTDGATRQWIINERRLTPIYAGGDDIGVVDMTASINAIFDFLRTDVAGATTPYGYTGLEVDMSGGIYRADGSINASNLSAWNVVIKGGVIRSYASGKNAFDLGNSRGYVMRNTIVVGVQTNMPATGIYCARGNTGAQACDNSLFDNITVIGHFTIAADYCYAQETTKRNHCRYWQMNHTGSIAIYNGYIASPQPSDFITVLTGSQSFGNNTYDNCDWRFLPSSNIAFATQVDKGASTVIHVASHPFVNGDEVVLHQFSAITALNGLLATVSGATATTFTLNIDSSGMSGSGTGITGRIIRAMTQDPLQFGRGNQHRFNSCYMANYAPSAIVIDFSDGFIPENNTFDFMIEGVCSTSHFKFKLVGGARKMRDVKIIGGGTQAKQALLSFDGGTGSLILEKAEITIASHQILATLPLCSNPAQISMIADSSIFYPNRAGIQTMSMAAFAGKQTAVDDGKTLRGKWHGTFSSTISAASGTTGTATVSAKIEQISDTHAKLDYAINVTSLGDWAGHLAASLPAGLIGEGTFTQYICGRSAATGKMLVAEQTGATSEIRIRNYDNTFPGTGNMSVSGIIEFFNLN